MSSPASRPALHPAVVALAGELRTEVSRVAYHLRISAAASEMTPTRLAAMSALELRPEGLRPGDLAARMGISPASTTRLVEVMRDAGWLSKDRDPGDHRAFVLRLTAAGRQALADFRRRSTGRFAEDLAALDPQERAALEAAVPVLRRLADGRLEPRQAPSHG